MSSNGIGTVGMTDNRYDISEWRIAMPIDVDREVYIKNCYLTNTVTISNENGEYQHNIRIGKIALQLVDFPNSIDDFGSDVICVKAPYSGKLYVMDVFNTPQQYQFQKEDQFRFIKKNGIGTAGIIIDGRGKIILSVDGDQGSGNLEIKVTNKDRGGKLNVNVNGDIEIVNDGVTSIKTSTSFKVEYKKDSVSEPISIQIDENGCLINSNTVQLNESDEPILRGNKTVSLLESILNTLGNDSAGPYPLRSSTEYLQLKEQLEDLKSQKSFVQ